MAKFVWQDRNWVPYDPANPNHQGLPTSDYGWDMKRDTIPYYAVDVNSMLMQLAFPGAASEQTFATMFLTPERQAAIKAALARLTPEQARAWMNTLEQRVQHVMSAVSDQNFNNFAGQTAGQANDTGMNDANMLKGMGFNGAAQSGAMLRSHNMANTAIANENARRTSELNSGIIGQTPMDMDNPYKLDEMRLGIINGNMNSPMVDNVRGFTPGLEQQRRNNSFFGNLLNAGMNYFAGGGSFGNLFGGKQPAQQGHSWFGVNGKGW